MYRNIALLCMAVLLYACTMPSTMLPGRNESGLFGRFPENYVNPKTGFTLWMPDNMHAREGMYDYVVERYMDECDNGDYIGVKYVNAAGEVYKVLEDGTKIYAYYYYYTRERRIGIDGGPFFPGLKEEIIDDWYYTVFNIYTDKNGIITRCKYKEIE